MNWKDRMFRDHADVFRDILQNHEVAIDWTDVFGLSLPREPSRFAVLDLGCGIGRLLPQLAAVSSVTVGLDYSPELLTYASTLLPKLPNVSLICADFRELGSVFPSLQFDAFVRAYTSLGYFDHATELDILRQCHRIATMNAVIVLDTFNAEWFEVNHHFERKTSLKQVELIEQYNWSPKYKKVYCAWRYNVAETEPVEINFELDGYNRERVDQLLRASGWVPRVIGSDYSRKATLGLEMSERLIAIAHKDCEAFPDEARNETAQ